MIIGELLSTKSTSFVFTFYAGYMITSFYFLYPPAAKRAGLCIISINSLLNQIIFILFTLHSLVSNVFAPLADRVFARITLYFLFKPTFLCNSVAIRIRTKDYALITFLFSFFLIKSILLPNFSIN